MIGINNKSGDRVAINNLRQKKLHVSFGRIIPFVLRLKQFFLGNFHLSHCGSSTHWNSWLVKQDTIDSHIVPGLQLICDALTTEFLHPVMEMLGYPPEQIRRMVVWFDVSKLAEQVNTFKDALELFKVGAVSKETLRAAAGFDESDAPEEMDSLDPKVQLVVDMVTRAPSLAVGGGMIDLDRQLEALIDGAPYEPPVKETVVEDVVEEEPVDEGSAGGGLPDTYDEPAPEEMEAP